MQDRITRNDERLSRQADVIARSAGSGKDLPRVRELANRRDLLGIHAATPLQADHDADLLPDLPIYVHREKDADLRMVLTRMSRMSGLVLIVGPSPSGKSRSAAFVVQQELSDWRMLVLPGAEDLAELVDSQADLSRTVIWLDNIHNLLESGGERIQSGRTIGRLLRRLISPGAGPVVAIGTIWPDKYRLYTSQPHTDAADLYADARDVMGIAYIIDLDDAFTETEWARAQQAADQDPRLADALRHGRSVPATLANADYLVRRWRIGDPYERAVLSAAVDAHRHGHSQPIPATLLEALATEYLPDEERSKASPEMWFKVAVEGACQRDRGTAPLELRASAVGSVDGYVASSILLSHTIDVDLALQERTWKVLAERADRAACRGVSRAANEAGLATVAELAARRGDELGNAFCSFDLGVLLEGRGELAEAERFYGRAVAAGHVEAAFSLANLLTGRGEVERAEQFYRQAALGGHGAAAFSLANSLAERGEVAEAEQLYRKALDAGVVGAAVGLATLLGARGEVAEAEQFYRQAADAGDFVALNSLASLLAGRGELAEAERCYQQAAEAGIAKAAFNLASLLAGRGEVGPAEQYYQQAALGGHGLAAFNLASLLAGRGELAEAERYYQQAAEAGIAEAAFNLAIFLVGRGELAEAARYFRQAAEAGIAEAAFNLGALLAHDKRTTEAEQYFRQAAEAGNTEAAFNVATLLAERGDLDQAEQYYRQAADRGDRQSQNNLANLLTKRGDHRQAERYYRKAIGSGHTQAPLNFAVLLVERGDLDQAERFYRQATKVSNGGAPFTLAAMMAERGEMERAEQFYRQAIAAGHVAALYDLANVLKKRGDLDQAEEFYHRAIVAGHIGALDAIARLRTQEG